MRGWLKVSLAVIAAVFLVAGLRHLLALTPNGLRPGELAKRSDMAAYWTAGRLLDHGANPYGVAAVAKLEGLQPDQTSRVMVMRNAPWTLPFVAPLGEMTYAHAFFAWDLLAITAVLLALALLARRYRLGLPSLRGFLPLVFVPTYLFIAVAQTSWLVLLGLALFLYFEDRQPWAAGAGLFLATTKFNICFLFWPVLLLWVIDRRQWRPLGTLTVLLTASTLVALGVDHAVMAQYLHSFGATDLGTQIFPNLVGWLRHWAGTGAGAAWPAFVVPALGVIWAIAYYRRHRTGWRWSEQLPLLVLVSLILAPYSFLFDELIVNVAIIAAAAATREQTRARQAGLLAGFLAAQAVIFHLLLNRVTDHTFSYAWTPLTWLALYLLATSRRPTAAPDGSDLNAAQATA